MVKPTSSPTHSQAFLQSAWQVLLMALLCAGLTSLLWGERVAAQSPQNFRIPPLELPDIESSEAEADAAATTAPDHTTITRRVIVDSDPGVDDAAALIWLFSQQRYDVEIEAIVTVAGNTDVLQATRNARLLLDWLETDVTLVQGAATPLVQPSSLTPALIHGLDGLWFMGGTMLDPDSTDATEFYCDTLEAGMLVIALGPLTNIANAMDADNPDACPAKWSGVEVVSLGGSKAAPNQTPVTEFNYWQDPEAVDIVLESVRTNGAILTIVLSDAFSQFEIARSDLRQLERRGNEAIQNLLPILDFYMQSFEGGGETPTLPDPTAVIFALENRLGTAQSSLVKVLTGVPEIARGQTIVGLSFTERITMIATDAELSAIALSALTDPGFDLNGALFAILASEPDNATTVTDIDARRMQNIFMQGLRFNNASPTSGLDEAAEASDYDNHIYVPQIRGQE